ncbi:MAG: hypothetical protein WCK39_08985 [Methanomassiliicoccales archaeon]
MRLWIKVLTVFLVIAILVFSSLFIIDRIAASKWEYHVGDYMVYRHSEDQTSWNISEKLSVVELGLEQVKLERNIGSFSWIQKDTALMFGVIIPIPLHYNSTQEVLHTSFGDLTCDVVYYEDRSWNSTRGSYQAWVCNGILVRSETTDFMGAVAIVELTGVNTQRSWMG